MDYKFEFLNTQRTTNIILLLITFFIIVFVITFIIVSRNAQTVIVRTANNISNVVRPFSQLVQTVSNDIQSVQPLVQQVATNVQNAAQNGLSRVTPEVQRAQETLQAIPEKINAVVNDPLARQAYNDLVSKIRELFAKKGKINADELIIERYMKKLKKMENELERKSSNDESINIDHYERRLAKLYDNFYKDTKSKYIKILATKHIK